MTSSPGTRASDQDRERIAAALGGHYAVGRLTLEEFQERLDKVYAAKTLGDLGDLMTDLPGTDLSQLPGAWPRQPGGRPPLPERRASGIVQARGGHSAAWLTVALGILMIWLISGANGGPWLLWMVAPLVVIVLRRRVASGPRRPSEHRDHQPPP